MIYLFRSLIITIPLTISFIAGVSYFEHKKEQKTIKKIQDKLKDQNV